jgi:hypothetical protein
MAGSRVAGRSSKPPRLIFWDLFQFSEVAARLAGAGKSTIADLVEQSLHHHGHHSIVLDGDNVRHGHIASAAAR